MPVPDLRPDAAPQKYWEPQKWTARHELICDLHIAGWKNKQIAEELDMNEGRVSVILSDGRAHEHIKNKRLEISRSVPDVYERMKALGHRAVDVVEDDIRQDFSQRSDVKPAERAVRQKAAFTVLASLGYGPVNKSLHAEVPALPVEVVERSEKVIAEMKAMQGQFQYRAPSVEETEEAEFEDVTEKES